MVKGLLRTLARGLDGLAVLEGLTREQVVLPPACAHVLDRVPLAQEVAADAHFLDGLKAQRVLVHGEAL